MNRRDLVLALFLAGPAAIAPALAQNENRPRNRGGGGGQPVGVFTVVSIDRDARTLQLQGADGTVSTVKVPDGVYELGKLSPGDRIQVNFYVPDAMNPGLRAAAIWPAN
jgi:hypothetical protein